MAIESFAVPTKTHSGSAPSAPAGSGFDAFSHYSDDATRRGCERCGRRRPPSTIPGPVARATTAACVPRAATRRTRRPSEEARAREKRRSLSSCTRVCFSRTSSWRTSLRTIRQEKTTLKKYQDFVWTSPPESSVEGLPVARTLVAAASTWMAIDISDRRA